MYDLILRDATIVTSTGRLVADVATRGRQIAYVGPRPPRGSHEEISAIGKFLIPGVIDTAAQLGHDTATWERETKAAISGGVTTVVVAPEGPEPVVDEASAQRRIRVASGRSWCDFALWGAATPGNAVALTEARESGSILGVFAHLDGPTEEGLGVDTAQLLQLTEVGGVLGVQIDPDQLQANGRLQDALARARELHQSVHLLHLSTAAELQMLDPVRGDVSLTAGVTPHHLFLSTEGLEADQVLARTRPPVRPEQDRRTLWTALKRERLACVASDHSPTGPGALGVPGIELLLPLLLSAVKHGRLSLEQLVSLCCEGPARIFGLEGKGSICRGADADLVLFSESDLEKVALSKLLSSAGWSPYDEREAAPKPELVMAGGQIVARRGQLMGEAPRGVHLG